ncbi:MAG: hypothetical protein HGA35_01905, partial [Erysipelotrichaceae bacterium]|nr:hypothetical protein [Erysipelotrichaceae bacterium]
MPWSNNLFKSNLINPCKIGNLTFKQVVRPGDVLKLEVTLIRQRSSVGFASAKAYVDNNL